MHYTIRVKRDKKLFHGVVTLIGSTVKKKQFKSLNRKGG